ncbi:condensation domain-containing protein, partial [Pseudoalteromonas sp. P1-9]|uniref:condensation domain-containing protein n=1 Tax=Pseudoalteromonas sp. P1-9 TaxID=1710354 RepID=UPI001F196521
MVHSLPLDYPRPAEKVHVGAQQHYQLSEQLLGQLHQVARAHDCTLFMLVHGALSLVLSRHSYSQDIVVGTPVANRTQQELEPLIGFFVNTLVLRANTQHENLRSYLQHIRQVSLDAQANQDVPFEQLVEHCQVQRSSSHTPLFQIMLSMNTTSASSLSLPDVSITPLAGEGYQCKFDLELTLDETTSGLGLTWGYDTGLFNAERIVQLQGHLAELLSALARTVEQPDMPLRALEMLSTEER